MRRAGNARVVRPDEHFQFQPNGILTFVDYFRHELFEILLNIGVVLIRRDADIGGDAVAVLVEFVLVEKYAARSFDRGRAFAGLGL